MLFIFMLLRRDHIVYHLLFHIIILSRSCNDIFLLRRGDKRWWCNIAVIQKSVVQLPRCMWWWWLRLLLLRLSWSALRLSWSAHTCRRVVLPRCKRRRRRSSYCVLPRSKRHGRSSDCTLPRSQHHLSTPRYIPR